MNDERVQKMKILQEELEDVCVSKSAKMYLLTYAFNVILVIKYVLKKMSNTLKKIGFKFFKIQAFLN